jgi:hypothetical protein
MKKKKKNYKLAYYSQRARFYHYLNCIDYIFSEYDHDLNDIVTRGELKEEFYDYITKKSSELCF